MSSANSSSLFIGRNQESACHFRAKFHRSSHPPHAFRWGTCAACLNLPVGLVEAYLRTVMALLTLRRIPSISTPPVSSVNPMMLFFFSTHKWVCRAWAQHTISNLLSFACKRADSNWFGQDLHATVVADWEYAHIWLNDNKPELFKFFELFSSWQCFILPQYQLLAMEVPASSVVVFAHGKIPGFWSASVWKVMLSLVLSLRCSIMKHCSLVSVYLPIRQQLNANDLTQCLAFIFLHIMSTILITLLSKCMFSLFSLLLNPHHSSSGFCPRLLCHFFIFWLCLDLSVA